MTPTRITPGSITHFLPTNDLNNKGLHADKNVIHDNGQSVDLHLVRQGHTVSNVSGILPAIDVIQVFFNGFGVHLRFQSVDYNAVLNVRIVADIERLPLIAADGCHWRNHYIPAQDQITDNSDQRMHIGGLINDPF